MRVAVLVLILANFAVFAWLRWAPPQGGAADSHLVPAPAAGTQLVLLPPVAATQAGESVPTCLRIGPIASATAAAALASRLGGAGYSVQTSGRLVHRPDAWQVLLTGYSDAAAVKRAVEELRRRGVHELFVSEGKGGSGASISLGLFRDLDHARRRAAQIRARGFHPQIEERLRSETQHYLEVLAPTGASAAIRAVGGKIPVTHKACSAPAASAASTARAPSRR